MLILSNEDIEKILPVGACLEVLEEAYRDLGCGMAATVPRYDVFSPTKPNEFYEYKTMSGVLPNRKIAALRLNSSVVTWYEKDGGVRKDKLPVAGGDRYVGLVMLFSTETGEPLAIFPDGYVQKLRVAGASAIAARHLARKNASVMALLGSGWQASAHLITLSLVRDLKKVRVFSPTRTPGVVSWMSGATIFPRNLSKPVAPLRPSTARISLPAPRIQFPLCFLVSCSSRESMYPASSLASWMSPPTSDRTR